MELLQTRNVYCAFCGESIEVLVDCSIDHQEYVEDCQVCCRPLVMNVMVGEDGVVDINVRFEDE